MADRALASDSIECGLADWSPPRYPCPACGRETVEHVPRSDGSSQRICSAQICRLVVVRDNWQPEVTRTKE